MVWTSHTLRSHPLGALAIEIIEAAIEAVQPRKLAREWAQEHLPEDGRIWVLGAGKAAGEITRGLLDVALDRVAGGFIAGKHPEPALGPIQSLCGGHPVPDQRSLKCGVEMMGMAAQVGPNDIVLAPITGGASSLMLAPRLGHDLESIAKLTREALEGGVPIEALNAKRRKACSLKDGGLAQAIDYGAQVIGLVLGDVIGGDPHDVGSGPLHDPRSKMVTLANNTTALQAAARVARKQGLAVDITPPLRGDARLEGTKLARGCMDAPSSEWMRLSLSGGETTVNVRGEGMGGRNQELALAAAPQLMGNPHALLVTVATDGEDGPTDAAGAVVSGETVVRALAQGLDPDDHLRRNDSYAFFHALDDLLKPGPTQTNVCDLTLVFS